MDDQGRETIISQFGAIDDLNQRCELGFSAWRSEVGAFRLIIHYPNKMFSAYDFVKASNWERTNWN